MLGAQKTAQRILDGLKKHLADGMQSHLAALEPPSLSVTSPPPTDNHGQSG
ncbi:hypothetical protein CDEF62S_05445 [Castellaniella defragrans]